MPCDLLCKLSHCSDRHTFFQNSIRIWALTWMLLDFPFPQFVYSTTKGCPFLKASSIHHLVYFEAEGHQTKTCHPNFGKNQKWTCKLEINNCIKHHEKEQENRNANLNWKVCGGRAHLFKCVCDKGSWSMSGASWCPANHCLHCTGLSSPWQTSKTSVWLGAGGGKSYTWCWPAGSSGSCILWIPSLRFPGRSFSSLGHFLHLVCCTCIKSFLKPEH